LDWKDISHCIAVPFYNRTEQVKICLSKLIKQALPFTKILLLNDGSDETFNIQDYNDERIFMISHSSNIGIGAARNSIIKWCRENKIEIVIMIDSDCLPLDGFVEEHLKLHYNDSEAACYGGGIIGIGKGFWAKVDGIMSWVHSIPQGGEKEVKEPYLLPGTNISFKVSCFEDKKKVFNDRLLTGEDALLIRNLRKKGKKIMFSSKPKIHHKDRDNFKDVVKHSYIWGGHLYLIQFGNNFSKKALKLSRRILFCIFFLVLSPFFVLSGSIFTMVPWLKIRVNTLKYFPVIILLWIVKVWAIFRVAINPKKHMVY